MDPEILKLASPDAPERPLPWAFFLPLESLPRLFFYAPWPG